ncbi:MAG: S8 family serine peptidase [Candidatus Aureabacteria bacterium]|nr:S8 family serine peptidase [Candidatus Auribacterota bacterium]
MYDKHRAYLPYFLPLFLGAQIIFLHCATCAAGDYFYSSGGKHPLTRLENVWVVRAPIAGSGRAATVDRARSQLNGWERHAVRIVGSREARDALAARATATRPRSFVNPVFDYGGGEPLVVTDEFIVCFPPDLGKDEIERINRRYGAVILRKVSPRTFVLRAEATKELAALDLANAYVENGDAVFAHPNFISQKKKRFIPNDPYSVYQWHLLSVGQGGALPGQDVQATAAWDLTRGSPEVIIAVIDDGVDFTHEDLQGDKFVPGYDFYDNDADPTAVAENEDCHGTAVIGVAAANGNNGIGVTGIAPACRIMPIRLVAGPTSDEQDASAIRFAVDNGAWIISNSWGPPDGNPFILGDEMIYPLPDIVREAIDYAADSGRGGKGCVISWAAGNGNEPVGYDGYASYEKVMAVGACTDQGRKAYYSDYGPELDLCAPSNGGRTSGIWTTDYMGVEGYNQGGPLFGDAAGNYTSEFGGTSSAAPLAAGIAALLLSSEPDLTRAEVMQRLRSTADRVDLQGARYNLAGQSIWYGSGRINAYAALTGRTRHPQLAISANPPSLRRGNTLSLNFSLLQGSDMSTNYGTAYLVVIPPIGPAKFITAEHRVAAAQSPFVKGMAAVDMKGSLIPGVLLANMAPGRYTIYAAIVTPGGDPRNASSWIHNPSSATVDVLP